MALWVYARDRISIGPEINDLLADEASAGNLTPGDTLVFVAREMEQSTTWRVPAGYDVVLAADSYRTGGMWSAFDAPTPATVGIDTRGTAGGVGTRGAGGLPGVATASGGSPGKPGGVGGLGGTGTAGGAITLFAKTLYPVRLTAAGGAGGAGGIGGKGGAGGQGRVVSRVDIEIEPTSGGDGGRGGDGGAGGAGGDVSITYVSPALVELVTFEVGGDDDGELFPGERSSRVPEPPRNVPQPIPLVFDAGWVKGGSGGGGGAGGSPGPTFVTWDGLPPDPGATGAPGRAGADGVLSVQQVDEATYWTRLRAALPPDVREVWASHRFQLGRYYYRSFVSRHPERGGHMALAYAEFLAVLQLGSPALAAAASEQLDWIEAGLNGLGLPRDMAIKPDFDDFEQTYVQAAPLLAPMVQTVESLIQNAVALRSIDNQVRAAASAVTNSQAALAFDMQAAQAELSRAQLDSNQLARQLNDIRAEAIKANAELTAARFALEAAGPESAAVAVFGLIFMLVPGVKQAKDYVGVLVTTNNDPSLRYHLGTSDRTTPLGGLAFAINEVGLFWGLGKTQADVAAAAISSNETKIKDLLSRLVTTVFQIKRQEYEVSAAERRFDATQARVTAAQRNLTALQQAAGANVQDMRQVAGIVDGMLAAIGRLGELVVRNVFLAARALDILLFSNATVTTPPPTGQPVLPATTPLADALELDFGLVHPDVTADALLELRRGGAGADRAAHASAALTLAGHLAVNWQQAPGWIAFKDAANSLLQRLTSATAWIARSDGQTISSLRDNGRVGLRVGLADLPAAASEVRVKRVSIVLIGATVSGSVPSVVGKLTHGGYAQVQRRDGAELLVDGPALTDLVTVSLGSGSAAVGGGSVGISGAADVPVFFGRSPATLWQLDLTGPISQGLDLSALSSVQLAIEFYGTPALAPSPLAMLLAEHLQPRPPATEEVTLEVERSRPELSRAR